MIIKTNKIYFNLSKYLSCFILFFIFPVIFLMAALIGTYQTKSIFFLLMLIPFYFSFSLVISLFKMHREVSFNTETQSFILDGKDISKKNIVSINFFPSVYVIIKYKDQNKVKKKLTTINYLSYKKIKSSFPSL